MLTDDFKRYNEWLEKQKAADAAWSRAMLDHLANGLGTGQTP